jgi:hypothetical protein
VSVGEFLPFAFVVFVAVPLNVGRNFAIAATTANHLRGNLWRKTTDGGVAIAATRPDWGGRVKIACAACAAISAFYSSRLAFSSVDAPTE